MISRAVVAALVSSAGNNKQAFDTITPLCGRLTSRAHYRCTSGSVNASTTNQPSRFTAWRRLNNLCCWRASRWWKTFHRACGSKVEGVCRTWLGDPPCIAARSDKRTGTVSDDTLVTNENIRLDDSCLRRLHWHRLGWPRQNGRQRREEYCADNQECRVQRSQGHRKSAAHCSAYARPIGRGISKAVVAVLTLRLVHPRLTQSRRSAAD